jgi:hypothetical protein
LVEVNLNSEHKDSFALTIIWVIGDK